MSTGDGRPGVTLDALAFLDARAQAAPQVGNERRVVGECRAAELVLQRLS